MTIYTTFWQMNTKNLSFFNYTRIPVDCSVYTIDAYVS